MSTPTIMDFSRIEREFKRSDQRQFYVPCPGCGNFDWIRRENVHWQEGEPETVTLACVECGELISEGHKTEMLAWGEWRPSAVGDGRTRGYHLSGLYSPVGWNSWEAIVREFISAKQDPFKLKTWINTTLGETWEERGETVNDSVLFARREKYPADVPAGALVLIAGVDIQDDRIELEVVGWGPGEECWAIDYRVLWGGPGEQPVWTALSNFIEQTYANDGGEKMRVSAACVDSGSHHTQNVYHCCRHRQARRIFAINGMGGVGRPIVSSPLHRRSGRSRRPWRCSWWAWMMRRA